MNSVAHYCARIIERVSTASGICYFVRGTLKVLATPHKVSTPSGIGMAKDVLHCSMSAAKKRFAQTLCRGEGAPATCFAGRCPPLLLYTSGRVPTCPIGSCTLGDGVCTRS